MKKNVFKFNAYECFKFQETSGLHCSSQKLNYVHFKTLKSGSNSRFFGLFPQLLPLLLMQTKLARKVMNHHFYDLWP